VEFKGLNGAEVKEVCYEHEKNVKDGSFRVELGDIQSEEQRDVLLRLSLPPLDSPLDDCPILKASLSGFNVLTGQSQVISTTASIIRGENEEEGMNEEVSLGKLRIDTVEVIDLAAELADSGKFLQTNP